MELELVRVDFLDHADCSTSVSSLVPCSVWGLLLEETERELHVLKWCAEGDPADDNSETWCIVKHPGIVIDRIRWETVEHRNAEEAKEVPYESEWIKKVIPD